MSHGQVTPTEVVDDGASGSTRAAQTRVPQLPERAAEPAAVPDEALPVHTAAPLSPRARRQLRERRMQQLNAALQCALGEEDDDPECEYISHHCCCLA